jgi:Cu/Zn superoxide dismutase
LEPGSLEVNGGTVPLIISGGNYSFVMPPADVGIAATFLPITVSVQGLTPPGLHGFHLHQDGNTGDDCKAAGPHFNPYNVIYFFHISVSKF